MWGKGTDFYLHMLYERLVLMKDLLAETGGIFVHLDETIGHYAKVILDDVFGSHNYVNSITWKRSDAHSDIGQGAKHLGRICDTLYLYSKELKKQTWNMQYTPLPQSTVERWYRHVDEETGRRYNKTDITGPGGATKGNPVYEWKGITRAWRFRKSRMQEFEEQGLLVYSSSGMPYLKRYLDDSKGVPLQDLWDDIKMIRGIHVASEMLGYKTQKPESLLERVNCLCSNPGDLVADFFCVREGTRILTPPSPLSKNGEGGERDTVALTNSPSPSLGKGLGAGGSTPGAGGSCSVSGSPSPSLRKRLGAGDSSPGAVGSTPGAGGSTPIESLGPGNLVFTHRNRFMPVLDVIKREYEGEMLEITFQGIPSPLYITPTHPVAIPAIPLPKFVARVSTARTLRRDSTPTEILLWQHLRACKRGTPFRRQHPMGPFILDFYAPEVRLAIELDGSIHNLEQQQEYDHFREEMIERHEIDFLRVTNREVRENIHGVLSVISRRVETRRIQFDHRVRWIPSGELQVGMSVLAAGMEEQRTIIAIRRFQTRETVYNLKVLEDNSYVTECCTLHNCGSGTTGAVAERLGGRWIMADLGRLRFILPGNG